MIALMLALWLSGAMGQNPPWSDYKPAIDVPAVEVTREIPEDERPTCKPITCPTAKNCFVPSVCMPPDTTEKVWTCVDRKRILEHDEDSPAKYWCRLPQP